jgi:DNA-binding MarR family transcriptional regulator
VSNAFEDLATLDRLIHEPARLAVLTALSGCRTADFVFLQKLIGLTSGNASRHLGKLIEAELVEVEKTFERRMPRTRYRLTAAGRKALQRYWQQLERLQRAGADLRVAVATTRG